MERIWRILNPPGESADFAGGRADSPAALDSGFGGASGRRRPAIIRWRIYIRWLGIGPRIYSADLVCCQRKCLADIHRRI